MRITLRLILSLVLVIVAVASLWAWWQVHQEKARQVAELEHRSRILCESFEEAAESLLAGGSRQRLQRFVEKFADRHALAGVAIYGGKDPSPLALTPGLAPHLPRVDRAAAEARRLGRASGSFGKLQGRDAYLYAGPLAASTGTLVLYLDTGHIRERLFQILWNAFLRTLLQASLLSIVLLLVIRWSVINPVAQLANWMRDLRSGDGTAAPPLPQADLFAPITREVATFARHLEAARSAAEEEAKLRRAAETLWTPERLKDHAKSKLNGRPLLVVSNREPYMHLFQARKKIEVIVPAGGLVTALDPVLRSCGGTWVAQGSGDADFEVVDAQNRLRVPPEDPLYTLRRVALTKEEEDGYYYGFSNEGLWPLCHIAHARPNFRPGDWEQYQRVNQKFAEAALEEMEGVEEPCVLVQDYHFALLPKLIKQRRPDARVALFWHIPWTNPEAFGICPWQKELLEGMLGADLVGFHTQYHCHNFLDTVDRTLESLIDLEHSTVQREGHATLVKPFPISVAFQDPQGPAGQAVPDRAALMKELGIKAEFLGVGVDRLDYTKGILERLHAIERFLEKYPAYQGRFTFVQLGAPTRTHIKRYHDFLAEVESEAERVNWKFKTRDWKPVLFLKKHHGHQEILPLYRLADLCMVTSLHDGMNLVAKEFVAAREDGKGVLILSRFAGAARELRDALIVNPYDLDQSAEAIRAALEMDPIQVAGRMERMRQTVRENNIYRWAGNVIEELAKVRIGEKNATT